MTRQQTLLYFVIGTVNIIATMLSVVWLEYLTKPLLMTSLALFYFLTTKNNFKFIDKVVIAALLFSCAGDIFLMFKNMPDYFFILGLGSFLLAHLCYICIFSRDVKFNILKVLPILAYSAFMLYYLLCNIKSDAFKVAVFAYISVLTIMVAMAISRKSNSISYKLILLGAIIFAISDSCIGIDKFVNPIPDARFWIMATYITAQYLIIKGIMLGREELIKSLP